MVLKVIVLPMPATAGIVVGPGGQATYSLPVAVPPGIAGMAPTLALSYGDGGINGLVGVGWTLQGVSSITRCPASRPVDGKPRAVAFDVDDKLCLDGQRLIQTDGRGAPKPFPQQNDAAGRGSDEPQDCLEFRTEKDSFARIRACGAVGGGTNPSVGPARFLVWTKGGQLYEYGRHGLETAAASTALIMASYSIAGQPQTSPAVWAVRRISDAVGNYIDFTYAQRDVAWGSGSVAQGTPGHEWNVTDIRYTGRVGQAPANRVTFTYEDRPTGGLLAADRSEAYQWNNKNVSIRRLAAIRTYVNATSISANLTGTAVRLFKLGYTRSPATGRSRLTTVTECSGANEARCLPATELSYRDAGSPEFQASAAFAVGPVATLKMLAAGLNTFGLLTGDFDGDGRTDIVRWSESPMENQLWRSQGDGNFTQVPEFNLTSQVLGSAAACAVSVVTDFNGDGLSDILRTSGNNECRSVNADSVLFLSVGNGTFTTVALPASIDLLQLKANFGSPVAPCTSPRERGNVQLASEPTVDRYGPVATPAPEEPRPAGSQCRNYTRTLGKRNYILDVDGDGLPDIVTTVAPPYTWNSNWGPRPSEAAICAGAGIPEWTDVCTRVFLGTSTGQFVERSTPPNVRSYSLYSNPRAGSYVANPYWRLPAQADIDGDGLQDILAERTGRWRSLGTGDFASSPVQDTSQLCGLPIDFNGDGRSDCLVADATPKNQILTLSYGAVSSGALAQFNVTESLFDVAANQAQSVGVIVEDFDRDGKQDMLRWGPAPADNGIYLSNGDGSFRARIAAGLQNIARPLQGADGTTAFVLGDFLGSGNLQILHLKDSPPATGGTTLNTNQLYARSDVAGPVDVLVSAKSPTGLLSTIDGRVPLTASASAVYLNDRVDPANAAVAPLVDLQPPLYVISSVTNQTGAGTITTSFQYVGLKAELGGRGLLGFRAVRQFQPTPAGGTLAVSTEYLLKHPYAGAAARSTTSFGASGPNLQFWLSKVNNTYCDTTSAGPPAGATEEAPCAGSAKVSRPYLLRSISEQRYLNAAPLPTVTTMNIVNEFGDPVNIAVTTRASFAGAVRTHETLTVNTYCEPDSMLPGSVPCPNRILGNNWILGRLLQTIVTRKAPDLLANLIASPGTSPFATATTGTGSVPPQPPIPPTTRNAALVPILQILLDDD